MLRGFACVVVAVVAAACSHTVGAKVDANQFERGKATMADVVKQLGPPKAQAIKTDLGGEQTTVLKYIWVTVGPGGSEAEATEFFFNKDKILMATEVTTEPPANDPAKKN